MGGSFHGKVNQESKKWKCVIHHIKEETLKFLVQKSLALYYL